MALSHNDHKRIALNVAHELRKTLSGVNAQRLFGKHAARLGKPDGDEPPGDPEEAETMDEMMREMEQEREAKPPEVSPEEMESRGGMPSDVDAKKKKRPAFARR